MIRSKTKFSALFVTGILLLVSREAVSADFDYPELSVTPRASERIEIEAKHEQDNKWANFLPIEVGGAANIVAAAVQIDPNNLAPTIYGASAGALTLVGGLILQSAYTPYASGLQRLELTPKGSTVREKLIRERMAEEAINNASAMGQRLRWFGVLINASTPIVMASLSGRNGTTTAPKDYLVASANAAAFIIALAPIFFRPHWIDVAEQQADYKKRIFAPVASATIFQERSTGRWIPGVAISLARF